MAHLRCDECGSSDTNAFGSWDTPIKILCKKCSGKKEDKTIKEPRFIIEVFLNGRRLEYRASSDEGKLKKELEVLKETYTSSDCTFYFGSLSVC